MWQANVWHFSCHLFIKKTWKHIAPLYQSLSALMALTSLSWGLPATHPCPVQFSPLPCTGSAGFQPSCSHACAWPWALLIQPTGRLSRLTLISALPAPHCTWCRFWLVDRLPGLTLDLPHHHKLPRWAWLLVKPGHGPRACPALLPHRQSWDLIGSRAAGAAVPHCSVTQD